MIPNRTNLMENEFQSNWLKFYYDVVHDILIRSPHWHLVKTVDSSQILEIRDQMEIRHNHWKYVNHLWSKSPYLCMSLMALQIQATISSSSLTSS